MSAPEPQRVAGAEHGLRCAVLRLDLVEVAAFRGRSQELGAQAARAGWPLPTIGHAQEQGGRIALCVRPDRWLLLCARDAANPDATGWERMLGGSAAVIDQSSGWTALGLTGPAVRDVLARGCRLDLDPSVFPAGSAAATIIAQVPVILGALSSGLLLLTPSTTARHFREWLAHTAAPFGFEPAADDSIATVLGEDLA